MRGNTNFIDITGMQFGYLCAIKPTSIRIRKTIVWECICSCGRNTCPKILYVDGQHLRKGVSHSCQQQQHDQTIHPAIRAHFTHVRKQADVRGYTFDITLEQFHSIIKQSCFYCNDNTDIKIIYGTVKGKTCRKWRLRANGIDRADNNIGYIFNNCVPCCEWCNRAKDVLSQQEYLDHCKKVAAFNDH